MLIMMLWDILLSFIVLWSLGAAALARLGIFTLPLVGALTLLVALLSIVFWWRKNSDFSFSYRESIVLFALILLASTLFMLPAEHYFLLGDSAIYPNTAAVLARSGKLVFTYTPFEGLTDAQKNLFFLPVSLQPGVTERSYQGIVNGTFYLLDSATNTVAASRPPVVIAWMGAAILFGGVQAALWVTPVFGVLGVLATYFWGRQVCNPRVGGLAAFWLLVSFPQIHFSRTPYAEIVGQVLLLGALYSWSAYLKKHQLHYLFLGYGSLAAAFSARIDSFLMLGTVASLFLILIWRRDLKGTLHNLLALLIVVGISVALCSWPYASATYDLMMNHQLHFLYSLPLPGVALVGAGVVIAVSVCLWNRENIAHYIWGSRSNWRQFAAQGVVWLRWLLAVGVMLLMCYALYIRPLHEEYTVINGQVYHLHNEELLAVAARYVTPLLIWLAACGAMLIIGSRHSSAVQLLSVFFFLSFALVMFWKYTTARVYPVALRRIVSDVLPAMCVMAAISVEHIRGKSSSPWRKEFTKLLVGFILASLFVVWPNYWFYEEAEDSWNFLTVVDDLLPPNAVILFEPQEQDRVAGWWATPLWSFYQQRALVLNPWFGEHVETLETAICHWQDEGVEVYLMAQREPKLWWPLPVEYLEFAHSVEWNSSIVGQSNDFPPVIWRFAFEFSLFRIRDSCYGS